MNGRKLWLLIYLQHKTTFPTNMAVKLWNSMFFIRFFNTLSKIWQFLAFNSQKTTWSADISHNLLIDGFSQSYSYTDNIELSHILWLSSLMFHSQKNTWEITSINKDYNSSVKVVCEYEKGLICYSIFFMNELFCTIAIKTENNYFFNLNAKE